MFIIFLKIYIFKQLTERLLDGLGRWYIPESWKILAENSTDTI
jgi:hypothetical protein